MSRAEIDDLLARYDRENREQPMVTAGLRLDEYQGVLALVGHFNFVCSWCFASEHVEAVVNAWTSRYREQGEVLMWPVYSHDPPRALPAVLERAGFVKEETATLMAVDVQNVLRQIDADATIDVRRVCDVAGLRDYVSAGEAAFEEADTWQENAFSTRLNDSDLGLYVGYVDGRAVASGRIEMGAKRSFAELFGGGVAPAHRGTGLYKALVAVRAQAAADFGSTYLATTARDTSRPILERLGFFGLATRSTWVLRP